MSEREEWLVGCLTPFSGPSPAGRDMRHEPDHERIRSEVEKSGGLHGGAPNWVLVDAEGQTLLARASKDLLIATYVAFARAKLYGLAGLTQGLQLLSGLADGFADGLHPARARARANVLVWFSEQVAELPMPELVSATEAEALRRAMRALRDNCAALLGDDAPAMLELQRLVDRLLTAAPSPAPAPVGPPLAGSSERCAAPRGLAEDVVERVAGQASSGRDTSTDDAYAVVQAEIDKLQGVTGEQPNWPLVARNCANLLAEETKDVTLAAFLAAALLETEGLRGLCAGIDVVTLCLDRHWEGGFPPLSRIKRRTNAMTWLVARVARELAHATRSAGPPAPGERAALEARIGALQAAFAQRLPHQPELALGDWLAQLPADTSPLPTRPTQFAKGTEPSFSSPEAGAGAPSPAPLQPPAAVASPGTVHTVTATPISDQPSLPHATPLATAGVPGAEPDPDSAVSTTSDALVATGARLFESDRRDPRAYRLTRIGLWLELDSLPPLERDGKSAGRVRVRAPDKRVREALLGALAAEQWEAALIQSEGTLRRNPLWLDTCCASHRALSSLGPEFASAAAVVANEGRSLAARLPQLLDLHFIDGTPLASPETTAWLRPEPPRALPSATPAVESQRSELATALKNALAADALTARGAVDDLLRQAPSGREAFLIRLQLAQLLEDAGRLETAGRVYLGLERDVDEHALGSWEPALACEVYSRLWSLMARNALPVSPSDVQRVCAKLAKLSPLALA